LKGIVTNLKLIDMKKILKLSRLKVIILLTVIMTTLKLSGLALIPWWLVTLPLWIGIATALLLFAVAFITFSLILILTYILP